MVDFGKAKKKYVPSPKIKALEKSLKDGKKLVKSLEKQIKEQKVKEKSTKKGKDAETTMGDLLGSLTGVRDEDTFDDDLDDENVFGKPPGAASSSGLGKSPGTNENVFGKPPGAASSSVLGKPPGTGGDVFGKPQRPVLKPMKKKAGS